MAALSDNKKPNLCRTFGSTSTLDLLSFYRHRPDSPTPLVRFDDWMVVNRRTDETFEFNVDYKNWLKKLNDIQMRVLNYLIQGYKASKIAELIKTTSSKVKEVVLQLQHLYVSSFIVG
ncbi:MAG: hypothetical protein V1773_13905 [bacterium]